MVKNVVSARQVVKDTAIVAKEVGVAGIDVDSDRLLVKSGLHLVDVLSGQLSIAGSQNSRVVVDVVLAGEPDTHVGVGGFGHGVVSFVVFETVGGGAAIAGAAIDTIEKLLLRKREKRSMGNLPR